MKKRISALLLALLLLTALFTGCAAKSADTAMTETDSATGSSAPAMNEKAKYDTAADAEPAEEPSFTTSATTEGSAELDVTEADQSLADATARIIYSAELSAETTQFDVAVSAIDRMVQRYQGFVESSSINGDTCYNSDGTTTVVDRCANYTLRIPADKFEEFMDEAGGVANVISSYRYAENVTSTYTDYEARLTSLYTQEERLLSMLEKSEDVDSLIALEERLANVRYEIESIERSLRNLDTQIRYSTITLTLREVEVYTPTVPVQRTFGEKLSDAFSDGWYYFGRSVQRFILNVAEALPNLLLFAAFVAAAVLLVRRAVKKHRARRDARTTPPDDQTPA